MHPYCVHENILGFSIFACECLFSGLMSCSTLKTSCGKWVSTQHKQTVQLHSIHYTIVAERRRVNVCFSWAVHACVCFSLGTPQTDDMTIFVLKESVSSPRKFFSINTLIFLYCTYHIPAVVEFLHQNMIYSTYTCTHQPLHYVHFSSARLELVQP